MIGASGPSALSARGGTIPVLSEEETFTSVTNRVSDLVLERTTTKKWLAGIAASSGLLALLLVASSYLLVAGIGIWGVNVPVAWGFAIVNFVWWIGIGHAGTLISAILLLMHQPWRNAISRFAEAMTVFALACAGLFPLLHLGRPWFFYWMLPYANTMNVWPQFRSALIWDMFAILSYLVVSLLFWYIGMVPDLAALRDRARSARLGRLYAMLALGWRGEASQWHRFEVTYLLLAGLATPLVVSVHSIVAFDFAVTVLPGWHSTIFPPYFVAGAMHSGLAMVLVLAIPLRRFMRLDGLITQAHYEALAKVMLTTGLAVAYGYVMESFGQWYSGSEFEAHVLVQRSAGQFAVLYWSLVACNVIVPQLLWFRGVRARTMALWSLSVVVLVGMWLERLLIVVTSLEQDFLFSSWGPYRATIWDWATFAGTFGLFFVLFLLFVRCLPVISIFEVRQLIDRRDPSRRVGVEGGES